MSHAESPVFSLAAAPVARLQDRLFMPVGVLILAAMFLGIAVWNGFPLMFYDTAGYLVEGLSGAFLVERSPVYSLLLLFTGAGFSLWLVVILQALMTATLIALAARIEVPDLSLPGLAGIGAALMTLTGIGWYVGQVEPDCMTALVILGCYLLLFRLPRLTPAMRRLVIAITALAVASHPSHLGLIGGLLLLAMLLRAFAYVLPGLPEAKLKSAGMALALALAMIIASNLVLARGFFISHSGPDFVFGRLVQDGIIKRLLDDTCPGSGYDLCPDRGHLPHTADSWLWNAHSPFYREGGFARPDNQDARLIADSLRRYPLMQLKAAVYDSVLQFFMFRTGDGIESQASILKHEMAQDTPRQLPAYLHARQQRQKLRFQPLNMIHVTVGMLSLLGAVLLLYHAALRRRWDETALPGLVLAGLIGNAIICGTFSNPHDRYQSRIIWLPALVLLLARSKDPRALQPALESGT